jgi:polysaccharide export outer membrane protein
MKKLIFFLIITSISFSSCKYLFPNYLLRETKDFYYYEMTELEDKGHIVLPGDFISFSISPLKGFGLLDNTAFSESEITGGANANNAIGLNNGLGRAQFFVRTDGYVDLPILGELYVNGMKRLDLEKQLREKFSSFYNDPFLVVNISNRRAFLFAGMGNAQVVVLPRENTTLIEVIALAGGVAEGVKSHKIRVIRGDYNNPTIKKIDLSTIGGLKDADLVINSNDLIIMEPVTRALPTALREIAPIMSLLTTAITLISIVILLKK